MTEIKYKLIENIDNELLVFTITEVPQKMIVPCKYCGVEFNSTSNYICYKTFANGYVIDTCVDCSNQDDSSYDLIVSLDSLVDINTIITNDVLPSYFSELVKLQQAKRTLKQQKFILMLIKKIKNLP